MEVTVKHTHTYVADEEKLRRKLTLVRRALRLDKDVLNEMKGELAGFARSFERLKAVAMKNAAQLETENARSFV